MSERSILKKTYEAFNNRDIDAVLSKMHKDVDWPNGWEGGRVYGHVGVRDYWTRQWKVLNPRVEPLSFEVDPTGRVIVDVHAVIRDLDGQVVADHSVRHAYRFENGLIRSMDIIKV